MIERKLQTIIDKRLHQEKAIIILGPRQVGKTTLVRELISQRDDVMWFNGDEMDVQELFSSISSTRFKAIFGNKKIIVVDEAQRISDIGLRLKLITDMLPEYQVIATGSSSFELANQLNEPLTGRKWEYKLFPLSFGEMVQYHGLLEEKRLLPHRMLYGYYPEIITHQGEERERLKLLTDSYLYKDILMLDAIKKTDALTRLLQAIAYQIGSQVSYNELSRLCEIDIKTVEKYILLLEQSYIIFRLGSFSRNLRSELKNSRKIYFYDLGVRNMIISNFAQIESRTDIGALWENFIIAERMKYLHNESRWPNSWFWRTVQQTEVDYLEEENGVLTATEFKWSPHNKGKITKTFTNAYPDAKTQIITKDNFEEFIL